VKLTEEYLYEKYIEQNLSVAQIMQETGATRDQIKGRLRRLGIRKKPFKLGDNPYDDKGWLYEQYMVQKKGYTVIADECGVSYTTILTRIRHFKWPLRSHKDIDKGKPRRGKKHTPDSLELIRKTRVKNRVLIECKNCNENFELQRSKYSKTKTHFCSYECFKKFLFDNRVETEDVTDSAQYKEWRLKVYKRDGYRCKMPDCNSTSRVIAAHHVYPKKIYPDRQFDINNGITLCRLCHEKTYGKEMQFADALVRVIQKSND
jgi:hypothetical protein